MKYSKFFILFIFLAIVAFAANSGYSKYSQKLADDSEANTQVLHSETPSQAESKPLKNAKASIKEIDHKLLKPQKGDILYGDASAPVRIVDYASLSCPHCARFHIETLPKLQKAYIDSGKVVVVLRHFPLNAPAMRSAMAISCADEAVHAKFATHLFETQRDWAFDSNYINHIANIANQFGLDDAAISKCFADVALEDHILSIRQQAEQKLLVASTPTFFINGKRFSGPASFENMKRAIDAALSQ
jgi:protein-disulfide isomerase